jgi:hypothetical protein
MACTLQGGYIAPNDTLLIYTSITENLGMREQPNGVFTDSLSAFSTLSLMNFNNQGDLNIKDTKYWTYKVTDDKIGTYKLIVDKSLYY